MLVCRDYDQELLSYLVDQLKLAFPDMIIDYILDVGSRAKGESTALSDYDFQITVRSAQRVLFSSKDINSDIRMIGPYMIDLQVATLYGVPLSEPDAQEMDAIRHAVEKRFRKNLGIVIADTRTCLLNLAFETAFSAYRTHWFTLTSNLVLDNLRIHLALQNTLISSQCWHWEQTIDLQILRFLKHEKLGILLKQAEQLKSNDDHSGILRSWNNWVLNYSRFAVGTWSLTRNLYYTYQRDDVLRFISSYLSWQHYKFMLDLYQQKDAIRLGLDRAAMGESGILLTDLFHEQSNKLDFFLQAALVKIREIRPATENDNRERNARLLLELFSEFCTVPRIDLYAWIEQSQKNCREILSSFS